MKNQILLVWAIIGFTLVPPAALAHRAYDFGGSDTGSDTTSGTRSGTTSGARTASSQSAQMPNPKVIAWALAAEITMGSMLQAMGSDKAASMLQQSAGMARALNVSLPALPNRTGNQKQDIVACVHYILHDLAGVAGSVSKRYGVSTGAAFDLSSKANLIQFLYAPGGKTSLAMAMFVQREAPTAGLPASIYRPFTDAVAHGASSEQFQAALERFDGNGVEYLQAHGGGSGNAMVSYHHQNHAVVRKHIAAQPQKPVDPEAAEFQSQFGGYFKSK